MQSVGVVPGGDEQGCGVVRTDAAAGQQCRAVSGDRVGDVVDKVVDLRGALLDAPGQLERADPSLQQCLLKTMGGSPYDAAYHDYHAG